jgi:hypothetical protein
MKNPFLRSLAIGCFLIMFNVGIITEYFLMNEAIKVDLNDKKTQKAINGKGILDITWDKTELVLAVTYDPKILESKDVIKTIQASLGPNNVGTVANPTHTK